MELQPPNAYPTIIERLCKNDPTLKELGGFGHYSAGEVASALSQNSTVTRMKFGGCGLDDDDCAAVMQGLIGRRNKFCDRCLPGIKLISLSRNRITGDGARSVAEFIRASSAAAAARPATCATCQKGRVRKRTAGEGMRLDLLSNHVGDEGAVAIADAIREAAMSPAAISNFTQDLSSDLPAASSYIADLGLVRNRIRDEGIVAISRMLECTSNLHTLRLGRNSISEEGIIDGLSPALKKNNSLEVLDLMDNERIGDKGAQSLGEALRFNTRLRMLMLTRCGTTSIGTGYITKALYNDESPIHILEGSNHTLEVIQGVPCSTFLVPVHRMSYCRLVHPRKKGINSVNIRQLLQWNKSGIAAARRQKLGHFLVSNQGSAFVYAADIDRRLFPVLLYKVWKASERDQSGSSHSGGLGVMYSYLRGVPDFIEARDLVEHYSNL